MKFNNGDFHWKYSRYQTNEQAVKDAIVILNKLTDEQIEAVRLYGHSCQEEGYDCGNRDH